LYFTSLVFIAFLALTLLLYYLVPAKAQWPLLLVASGVFYAFAGWQGLVYVSVTVVTTYLAGLRLGTLGQTQKDYLKEHKGALDREQRKSYKATMKKKKTFWLALCLVFNFGVLAATKVLSLKAISTAIGGDGFAFLVPLGISFYTFRAMSYVIDLYRGKFPAEKNIGKLALFTAFFPQVIQGPLSRYDTIGQTLFAPHKFDAAVFGRGAQRIVWGFLKKLVVADRLLVLVRTLTAAPESYNGAYAFAAMILYAAALYCDFTGGIDITIGVGEAMGIEMEENFLSPFRSKNIFEYWRRWHITMGTWFKDYIFYPISVSRPMMKLTTAARKKLGDKAGRRVPIYIATLITWFATGIWHGVGWNFVVWGLLNGVIILLSQECMPLYEKFHARFPKLSENRWYDAFQILRTFLLLSLIRSFDIYASVPMTLRQIGSFFTHPQLGAFFHDAGLLLGFIREGDFTYTELDKLGLDKLGLTPLDFGVVAVGLVLLFVVGALRRKGDPREIVRQKLPAWLVTALWFLAVFVVLIFGLYGIGFDAQQFIYNQF
jgi:D-alanyl-lipoteichoic acid acyltransferase DltB (MBOAT superfamily)